MSRRVIRPLHFAVSALLVTEMVTACRSDDGRPLATTTSAAGAQNGRLFFVTDGALFSVEPDGSNRREVVQPERAADTTTPLSPDVAITTVTCSPAGDEIAYTLRRTPFGSVSREELWISSLGGEAARLIIDQPGVGVSEPSWSPDGGTIAFSDPTLGSTAGDILSIARDGSTLTPLTHGELNFGGPDWSPGGDALVVSVGFDFETAFDLDIIDPATAKRTDLTTLDGSEFSPAWSSHDDIAFVSARRGDVAIYSIRPDGTGLGPLTNDTAATSLPEWSPTGTSLAYVAERPAGFEVLVLPEPESTPIHLAESPTFISDLTWCAA